MVTCSGIECNFCYLADMTNKVINWLFGFMAVVATVLFAVAGINLVTSGGNQEAMRKAKARLTYVVIGFLLMLASWLIVDTILKGLTGEGLEIWGSFNVENCGYLKEAKVVEYDELTFDSVDLDSLLVTSGGNGGDVLIDAGSYVPEPVSGGANYAFSSALNTKQQNDLSGPLAQLFSCMLTKVPPGTYIITSVSDNRIATGNKTWEECKAGGKSIGCAHTANSCHYGGRSCGNKSYALDIRLNNPRELVAAAKSCGGYGQIESNHVHVSIGAAAGCGCN